MTRLVVRGASRFCGSDETRCALVGISAEASIFVGDVGASLACLGPDRLGIAAARWGNNEGMQTLRTRTWPWFVLAAVILAVGVLVVGGDAGAIMAVVAAAVALAAAIRGVGLGVRDDPARQRLVGRGLGGVPGHGMAVTGPTLRETKGAKTRDHGTAEREQPPPGRT